MPLVLGPHPHFRPLASTCHVYSWSTTEKIVVYTGYLLYIGRSHTIGASLEGTQ